MYAVIKTGGKQYRVTNGLKLKVEQIPADVGAEVTLDQILMLGEGESVQIGAPFIAGATVKCTVISHGRHDKVKIFVQLSVSMDAEDIAHQINKGEWFVLERGPKGPPRRSTR